MRINDIKSRIIEVFKISTSHWLFIAVRRDSAFMPRDMKKFLLVLLLCAVCVLVASPVFANSDEGKSIPYFSRMPNYYVSGSMDRDFDEFKFLTGSGSVNVEGKKFQSEYYIKDEKTSASPLQIIRNYENAAVSMGGVKLFDGEDQDRVGRIATFKVMRGTKELWLDVNAYNDGNAFTVILIEKETMRQDISASGLMAALDSVGHVAVYINFDTGKSVLKPEHNTTISEVYKLLADNPGLKLTIEGHTDNVGLAADNKALSEKRAQAVVAALIQKGVSSDRLNAVGFGYEKPIADNSTEEGRAKNRRVELVRR